MERLRILRTKHHLYQKDVAEKLGIDRTTYVKYETGASEPDLETLIKIANIYGVTLDYLVGNDTQTTDSEAELTEYLEALKNRSEMRMLFSLAKGATKEDVERAVAIIEALKKNENG